MSRVNRMAEQAGLAREALAELAEDVIDRAPKLVNAATDELRSVGLQVGDQAQRMAEKVTAEARNRRLSDRRVPKRAKVQWRNVQKHGADFVDALPSADDLRAYTDGARGRVHLPGPMSKKTKQAKVRTLAWRKWSLLLGGALVAGFVVRRLVRGSGTDSKYEARSPASREAKNATGAYYTSTVDSDNERSVYHDRDDCPAGRRIAAGHRISGTDGRAKCKECQALGSSEDDQPTDEAVASRADGRPPEEATSKDPTAQARSILGDSEDRVAQGASNSASNHS
jgi:hypothetical protein